LCGSTRKEYLQNASKAKMVKQSHGTGQAERLAGCGKIDSQRVFLSVFRH
jgi:hypothetical protein